jgi:hypothetical protein
VCLLEDRNSFQTFKRYLDGAFFVEVRNEITNIIYISNEAAIFSYKVRATCFEVVSFILCVPQTDSKSSRTLLSLL